MLVETQKTVLNSGSPAGVMPPKSNGNGNGVSVKSPLHIKKDLGNGVQINVWGETPAAAVELLIAAIALCEGYDLPPSPAAARAHSERALQEGNTRNIANSMQCEVCGHTELKLITWDDKKTGKPVSKWRCQHLDCQAWQKSK
jgi:hypothetical protein